MHSVEHSVEAMGARRAMSLMFTVPERFVHFAHMDQKTFFELSDWILANVPSQISPDISVEESLFVFLDIVAQGNSFSTVAYGWDHDLELTQGYVSHCLPLQELGL
jgi:predicted SPOUT superfamily RNA methylase MTH1